MTMRRMYVKVAGVTFDSRQSLIAKLRGNEPCRIVPEPENPYDKNALAVQVAMGEGVEHIGYVPRELAAQIAPLLDGESVMVSIDQISGGFEKWDGEIASLGVVLAVDVPDESGDDSLPF
jgi:single-stranded-DNA-specific exonuclease